jgi:homogentisate 1,2-dioxygenase
MFQQRGAVPPKRHTQFRAPDGELYVEEVLGLEGFSGNESILYHRWSPCRVTHIHPQEKIVLEEWEPAEWAHRHLRLNEFPEAGDPVRGRQVLMFNNDVTMSYVRPTERMDYFYRNGQADELIYIHEGQGVLRTTFGPLEYRPGDYLVIPRGTTYQFDPRGEASSERHLIFETPSHFEIPKEYRNAYGQLGEHAPYYHRDIRTPGELEDHQDDRGEHRLVLKVNNAYSLYELDYHPFDVIGWDGYCYPWAFNIEDYEPKAGRIHQPPPAHLTFRGRNFVICSFVPRMMDWDELAIPIPYHHSNLDSEEVIYYVNGDFMSRKGIEYASVTVHPSGLPHGPQPGAVEASLGATRTEEWAVMIDTFKPLKYAKPAEGWDDPAYKYSWYTDTSGNGHVAPDVAKVAVQGSATG